MLSSESEVLIVSDCEDSTDETTSESNSSRDYLLRKKGEENTESSDLLKHNLVE